MFCQFARAEPPQQKEAYEFFTIRDKKVMGDIIPIGDESIFDIMGDYIGSPTSIIKAWESSDEPALFFGTRTKWCAYVSGRYITYKQAQVQTRGRQILGDDPENWKLQNEFWENLPKSSDDFFIVELNRIKDNELRKIERKREDYEEEKRLDREDRAHIERLPEDVRKEVDDLSEGLDYKLNKRPFAEFVKQYLAPPDKVREFGVFELLEHPEYWTIEWPYVPTFESLTDQERVDMLELNKMSRERIMSLGNQSGKRGKDGLTFIVSAPTSGTQYAVKTFDSDYPWRLIQREAWLQEKAASVCVSPNLYAVNTHEKYIIMEKMEETIVDYSRRKNPAGPDGKQREWTLPEEHQDRIIEIMNGLDKVGVLHNDGNPLNLMFNEDQKLMVIDFGLSTPIDEAIIAKRGPHPNINLSLWAFERQLGHYRIKTPKLKQVVIAYMTAWKKSQRK